MTSQKTTLVAALLGCLALVVAGGLSSADAQVRFAPAVTYAVGDGPNGVATGDLDKANGPDVVVTNFNVNTISILLNQGNGTFVRQPDVTVGKGPTGVTVADVNGDGWPDVIVTNQNGASVSVLLNNGNGTFVRQQPDVTVGKAPLSVVAVDVDKDGDLDLVVVNRTSNSISVLKNNGNGTFAAAVSYTVGASPRWVAAGDVNRDSYPDLVVVNANTQDVSVLLNDGHGGFSLGGTYPTGRGPLSVAVADLDGDGDNDIAVATFGDDSVDVFLNNGDGTFAPRASFLAGDGLMALTAGPLVRRGEPGIVTVASKSNIAVGLVNNGLGGLTKTDQNFAVGKDPVAVAMDELNGDESTDVVVANFLDNTISVLLGLGTPDLKVTALTEPPAILAPNTQFTVAATITNAGALDARSSRVYFFLGTGRTHTAADVQLKNGDVGLPNIRHGLGVATGNVTVTVPAGVLPGRYILHACADALNQVLEGIEGNNCKASAGTLDVIGADLAVTGLTGGPPASAKPGTKFSAQTTVTNQGTSASAASTTLFFLMPTGAGGTTMQLDKTMSVPKLAVGAAQSTLVSFVIPLTALPATYSFVACADGLKVVPEVDENNNCVAVAQTVNVPGPDLQVTSVTNKAATLVRGGVLSITDIVANAGPVNAGATRLEYYLSAGGTRILFGSRDVPALAAGKTSRGSVTAAIAATVPSGTYTVLACADVTNVVVETNEGNNCLASSSQVTVK